MSSLADHLEQFRARVLADALNEASAAYWLRRAVQFDNARPRPGDYTGAATPQQLAQRDARLAEVAQACRAAADVALLPYRRSCDVDRV